MQTRCPGRLHRRPGFLASEAGVLPCDHDTEDEHHLKAYASALSLQRCFQPTALGFAASVLNFLHYTSAMLRKISRWPGLILERIQNASHKPFVLPLLLAVHEVGSPRRHLRGSLADCEGLKRLMIYQGCIPVSPNLNVLPQLEALELSVAVFFSWALTHMCALRSLTFRTRFCQSSSPFVQHTIDQVHPVNHLNSAHSVVQCLGDIVISFTTRLISLAS